MTRRRRCKPLGCCVGLALAAVMLMHAFPAAGAYISEVVTDSAYGLPQYVEINAHGHTGPLQLAILDGRTTSPRLVLRTITLPETSAKIFIIHDGTWPVPLPGSATAVQQSKDLLLTGPFGASRRLVLLDHYADWRSQAPPIDQWTGVLDVLAYSVDGWPIDSQTGETPLLLQAGEAIHRDQPATTNHKQYTVGSFDHNLRFEGSGAQLSPGLSNIIHTPEPTSAVLMLAASAWCVRRRRA